MKMKDCVNRRVCLLSQRISGPPTPGRTTATSSRKPTQELTRMAEDTRKNAPNPEQSSLHKAFALMQLRNALLSLKAAEGVCGKCSAQASVVPALIRDAVVQYGSIFGFSHVGGKQKHRLTSSLVPGQVVELHRELLAYRNQLFAHIDFEPRTPVKVVNDHGVSYRIGDKGPQDFADRLQDIMTLIDRIMNALGAEVLSTHQAICRDSGASLE